MRQHLRHVPAHHIEVQAFLCKWKLIDEKCMMSILCNGTCYLDLLAHDNIFDDLLRSFGKSGFSTLMNCGVASRLQDPNFIISLNEIRRSFKDDSQFVTFMSNSITSRLQDPGFIISLNEI